MLCFALYWYAVEGQPYLPRELAHELMAATVVNNRAKAKILFFIAKRVCCKTVYFAGYFTKVENVNTQLYNSLL
jgi:hypothetical protein